jgi:hypothetical protein
MPEEHPMLRLKQVCLRQAQLLMHTTTCQHLQHAIAGNSPADTFLHKLVTATFGPVEPSGPLL